MENILAYGLISVLSIVGLIFVISLIKCLMTPQSKVHEENLNAALNGDFAALCELVNEYMEGQDKKYFEKYPDHAVDVFHGAEKLVEIVESNPEQKAPEFEDYYWLGLMYEEGFGTQKDITKAVEYFNKALNTETCWCGDEEHYESMAATVRRKLQQYS